MTRTRHICTYPVALAAALLGAAATGRAQDNFRYELLSVSGQPTAADAVALLKQRAVEKAVEELLGGRTGEARDEALERRLVSRARDKVDLLVTLKIHQGPQQNEISGWSVIADAEVSRARLEELRAGLDQKLDQPQPRVLVLISERIESTHWPWGPAPFREHEIGSLIAQQIEAQLLDHNFKVISAEQFEFLRDKRVDFANLSGADLRQIRSLAADQGCEILILGRADVTGPRVNTTAFPGRKAYFWITTPKISVLWQDSAEKLAVPIAERDCRESGGFFEGPAEARGALEKAGGCIGRQVVQALLKRVPAAGATRDIRLLIVGADAKQAGRILEQLRGLSGLTIFEPRLERHGIEVPAQATLGTFELALKISALEFGGAFSLVAEQSGPNTLELKVHN